MKVLIAAGGTGGHVNPALAVAGYLKKENPFLMLLAADKLDKMEEISKGDKTMELNNETLDKLVNKELQKPATEMDKSLIDLCLNALVAYRAYTSESKE